jgi:hypothetical protein
MSFLRQSLPLALVFTACVTPGAAFGSGGGGSTPPPTAPPIECDYAADGWTADGGYVATSPVKNAGCVSTITTASTIRLYNVTIAPGWTYTVTSDGAGTNSRVAVQFSNPTTPSARRSASNSARRLSADPRGSRRSPLHSFDRRLNRLHQTPGRFSLAVQPGAPSSRSASSTIRPSGPRT